MSGPKNGVSSATNNKRSCFPTPQNREDKGDNAWCRHPRRNHNPCKPNQNHRKEHTYLILLPQLLRKRSTHNRPSLTTRRRKVCLQLTPFLCVHNTFRLFRRDEDTSEDDLAICVVGGCCGGGLILVMRVLVRKEIMWWCGRDWLF